MVRLKLINLFKQRVIGHSLIYVFSNLLNSLIPFLLLPSYTNNLAPSELGLLSIFDNTLLFSVPIIMFGCSGVLSVDYFKKKRIYQYIFSSGIMVPLLVYCIFIVLAIIFYLFTKEIITYSVSLPIILVTLTIALFQALTQIRLMLFQVSTKPFMYMALQFWVILSSVTLTLYFVIYSENGWEGRLQALLVCFSVSAIISAFSFVKEGVFSLQKVSFKKIKYVFKLGSPLVPHALGMLVIVYFDRFLISYYWGLEELGRYVVGHQIGMGISLLQNSFTQAWGPMLFKLLKENTSESRNNIVKVSFVFMMFIFSSAIGLVFMLPAIYSFFIHEGYKESAQYVIYIAIGFAFTGMYKLFVGLIFYSKKNILLAYIAIFNVIINLLLNYFLIPSYGAKGAAISFMFSMFFLFLLTFYYSYKIYPLNWLNLKRAFTKGY